VGAEKGWERMSAETGGESAARDLAPSPPPFGPSLAGQVFVVVGGGGGIGGEIVRHLVARRASAVVADRDRAAAERVVASVVDVGRATAVSADVTEPSSLEAAVAQAIDRFGTLHGVCNAAGITGETGRPSHEIALADFDRVVAVNLRGAFALSQAALPPLLERRYGRILHIASIAGKEGNAGMVSYSASKAGLIGMVKSQGKEYATSGVTVNAMAPAVIRTELVERMPPAQVEYMTSRIPMARCATLAEAAELAAWILSPAASFTTGFTFDLTGGRAVY